MASLKTESDIERKDWFNKFNWMLEEMFSLKYKMPSAKKTAKTLGPLFS